MTFHREQTVKITMQRSVLQSGSLLKKESTHKIEDIRLVSAHEKNTKIGQPVQLVSQIASPYLSIDAITATPLFPISIKSQDTPIIEKLGRLLPMKEALVLGVLLLVLIQSTFLLNAGVKLKDTLFQQTLAGIEELKTAKTTLSQANFAETLQHFVAAKSFFTEARKDISAINGGVSILPSSLLNTSNNLLHVGESIASIGSSLTQASSILLTTANFKLALPEFKKAQITLREASMKLNEIDANNLPESYRARFVEIQNDLPLLRQGLDFFDTITPALLNFTAEKTTKRYLIMLQNTAERRGTGGFMGSFIEVTFQNGKLTEAQPKDVYTVDWQQFNRKATPTFLQPYMKGLALRDANYNPDFYQASTDINWAYEQSRQGSVDGIIAIDQNIVPILLEATGPIFLPDFNITITKDNFFQVLQFYIETNKDDPNTPKRILLSFIKEIAQKFNTLDAALKASQFIPDFINEKHVQMAFFDPELETAIQKYSLDGRLQAPAENLDYLHINAINVGGNKGDSYLKREYNRTASIAKDGSITINLTGTWSNQWSEQMENELTKMFPQINNLPRQLKENFWYVIGKSPTKHVVRFFVPKGSVLTGNSGLSYKPIVGEENGYEVWYGEVNVPLGGKSTFSITYTLPFKLNVETGDTYRFLMQKQAGAEHENLQSTIALAPELEPLANYPSHSSQGANSQTISTDLNTDKYFELLVRKQ